MAQHPALLLGRLTVDQAAASDATLAALLASIGVGLLIVGPCLAALYGMALTGRLAAPFRPLGARPRPGPTRDPGRRSP